MSISKCISVIDCSEIIGSKGDTEANKTEFSQKLGDALSGIGFTYLINHGVDLQKVRFRKWHNRYLHNSIS